MAMHVTPWAREQAHMAWHDMHWAAVQGQPIMIG